MTDFIRVTHGERLRSYVLREFRASPLWNVNECNLADLVARLCFSHVRPASDLVPENGYRHDESFGRYRVNMPYLGLVLRLADILDFDRERTPNSLYRTVDFRSQISLQEWEKHRSVEGWVIEPTLIQFTMRCQHPEYQRAAYQFMDWIDKELAAAQFLIVACWEGQNPRLQAKASAFLATRLGRIVGARLVRPRSQFLTVEPLASGPVCLMEPGTLVMWSASDEFEWSRS